SARRTQGRTVVSDVLNWAVPPQRLELGTTTTRPRTYGGVETTQETVERDSVVQEITDWFGSKGIDLYVEREGDTWTAVMIPQNVRLGSADYGTGNTPAEAAEEAKRRFLSTHPDAVSKTVRD